MITTTSETASTSGTASTRRSCQECTATCIGGQCPFSPYYDNSYVCTETDPFQQILLKFEQSRDWEAAPQIIRPTRINSKSNSIKVLKIAPKIWTGRNYHK